MTFSIKQFLGWHPLRWGFCGSRGFKRVFFEKGLPGYYTVGPFLIQFEVDGR